MGAPPPKGVTLMYYQMLFIKGKEGRLKSLNLVERGLS